MSLFAHTVGVGPTIYPTSRTFLERPERRWLLVTVLPLSSVALMSIVVDKRFGTKNPENLF